MTLLTFFQSAIHVEVLLRLEIQSRQRHTLLGQRQTTRRRELQFCEQRVRRFLLFCEIEHEQSYSNVSVCGLERLIME